MSLLLPIFYTALFAFIIYRLRFFRDERLSKFFFVFIFFLKVAAGIAYTSAFWGGDTTMYFYDADKIIYPTLWNNPLQYFYLTFGPNGGEILKFIRPQVYAMGYWGDTSAYMVVRFNAVVRLFSFGNFYVHAVCMAFVSLLGLAWLYKAYSKATGGATIFSIAAIFLIPSVVFWGSGVHKEGLLLFALGLFFYGSVLLSKNINLKNLALFSIGACLVFLIRDFVFLLLFPGILAFFISANDTSKAKWAFPLFYLLFFSAGCLLPVFNGNNFLEIITSKQEQFLALNEGNTQIDVRYFNPTLLSLFVNLPHSLKNSIAGPFFISPDSLSHIAVMLENGILILIALFVVLFSGKPRLNAFTIWLLIFSLSLLILIGYIVPNVGAIVRYRSIVLPFFFLFLLSGRKT